MIKKDVEVDGIKIGVLIHDIREKVDNLKVRLDRLEHMINKNCVGKDK